MLEGERPRALAWNGEIRDPSLWLETPWTQKQRSLEATIAASAAFFTATAYLVERSVPSEALAAELERQAAALKAPRTSRRNRRVENGLTLQGRWVWNG